MPLANVEASEEAAPPPYRPPEPLTVPLAPSVLGLGEREANTLLEELLDPTPRPLNGDEPNLRLWLLLLKLLLLLLLLLLLFPLLLLLL